MKKYIITIIIGLIVVGCGGGLFAVEVMDYDYIDSLPTNVTATTLNYTYDLNDDDVYIDNSAYNVIYTTDDKIAEGTIKISVSYYDKVNEISTSDSIQDGHRVISYFASEKITNFKYFYNLFMDNLKDKKVYNYEYLDNVTITVHLNSKDTSNVKNYDSITAHGFYISDETVICNQMLEEIARDTNYIYYLNCLKSSTVYLVYDNGTKISVKTALNTNVVTIYELIDAGLEVIQQPISE